MFVGAGQRRSGKGEGTLSVVGLGSCVVIVLYDETSKVGALAHVLLPEPRYSTTPDRKMKFASTAVPLLIEELVTAGARRDRLKARLIGGSSMFADLLPDDRPIIGQHNVLAARAALAADGIPVVGEEVGGDYGRSIHFKLQDGSVRVTSYGRADVCV